MVDVPDWTFLTNHAHVLVCIARDPDIRIREIAIRVGITERAAQRIVADLIAVGYITSRREGRRNHYRLDPTLPLRHPLERDHQIGEIIAVLRPDAAQTTSATTTAGSGPEATGPAA